MKTLILTAGMWLAPVIVLAQAAPEPPPRQEGSAEFAFVSTRGNSDTQTLGLSGEYHYRTDPWHLLWKAAYVRNESEDVLNAESSRFLFRTERSVTTRASLFGQWGYMHDVFAAIDHRNSITGGLSYQLVAPAPHELWVDGGFGYTNEQRLIGDDLSTAIGLTAARYKFQLSDTAEITDDLGFEFSIPDGHDWRLANIVAVTAKLTTVLALRLGYTVRYVNAPAAAAIEPAAALVPVGPIEKTDTVAAFALVAKF